MADRKHHVFLLATFTGTGTQSLSLARTHAWTRRNAPSKSKAFLVLRPFFSYPHFLGDQLTAANIRVTLILIPPSQVSLRTLIPVFKCLESPFGCPTATSNYPVYLDTLSRVLPLYLSSPTPKSGLSSPSLIFSRDELQYFPIVHAKHVGRLSFPHTLHPAYH